MHPHISAIVILAIANSVICYTGNGEEEIPALISSKTLKFPLVDGSSINKNDRPVYDPGVDILSNPTNLQNGNPIDGFNGNEIDSDEMQEKQWLEFEHGFEGNVLNKLKEEIKDEEDIAMKSAFLLQLLENSSLGQPMPIIYVENETNEPTENNPYPYDKRSGRYYQRYPWKRQNSRYRTYEADQRYLCVPSREEVFKLLVGLHEGRNGNRHKTVKFCDRKRPAKAIFTNIRFLG